MDEGEKKDDTVAVKPGFEYGRMVGDVDAYGWQDYAGFDGKVRCKLPHYIGEELIWLRKGLKSVADTLVFGCKTLEIKSENVAELISVFISAKKRKFWIGTAWGAVLTLVVIGLASASWILIDKMFAA